MTASCCPCLAVEADLEFVDDLSSRLHDLGSSAIEIRDQDTMTPQTGARALLLAGFADPASRDAALTAMTAAVGSAEIRPLDVTDDGWSTRWREFFQPVVLERLQVVTPWMTAPRADRLSLVIDPGQAFGTGGHPTTRLVLELLEGRARRSGLPRRVLDVGTGSGVLAIAAALLGAESVHGIDIDPEAVSAADDNVRVNRVGDRVTCSTCGLDDLDGTWPLVLANIELAVFERLAPAIADRVAIGGELLVSGLLEEQVAACRSLFAGFLVTKERELQGWAALALVRG